MGRIDESNLNATQNEAFGMAGQGCKVTEKNKHRGHSSVCHRPYRAYYDHFAIARADARR